MNSFSDRLSEFQKLGAEVVAVSTDSAFSHQAWANVPRNKGGIQGIKTPILGDFTKTISRDYGVLFEANGAALRGTFIINPEGTVVHSSVNFFPVGRSVSEAARSAGLRASRRRQPAALGADRGGSPD